ncbi:hypothetical protein [Nostoc sp. T09]|nr:hypothetical protein [Nostoc sp. T09]
MTVSPILFVFKYCDRSESWFDVNSILAETKVRSLILLFSREH